jgi:hypothetical protein
MDQLLSSLETMDQDQVAVVLMAAVLVFSLTVIAAVAILRALGKWGTVALFAGAAAVIIAVSR